MDERYQSLAEKISDAFYVSESNEVQVPVTHEEAENCFYPDYEGTTNEFDAYLIDQFELKPLTADFDAVYMILTIELELLWTEDCDCDDGCGEADDPDAYPPF